MGGRRHPEPPVRGDSAFRRLPEHSQVREFNVYFNSGPPNKYSSPYLAAGYVYSTVWYRAIYGDQFNVTLAATAQSVLPPMLNAYEIYTLIVHDTPTTFQQDGKQTTTLLKKQNHTHTYIILLPPS
jgi:hypothetical protein